jgi:diguanylate cyclase (GGDEF)-like protein/PAS domain S-box-containing protein
MLAAPLPPDEARRLTALRDLDVLDTAPYAALDAITEAASVVCGTPISLIGLIDEHRQWFKSNIGLDGVTETPRNLAFCAYTILGDGIFEVENASEDVRFADNPLVRDDPHIRAYAGVPLVAADGSKVGTLCVIDRQTRRLDERQRHVLVKLARAASQLLEQWRISRLQAQVEQRLLENEEFLDRTGRLVGIGGWSLSLVTGNITWSAETYRIHGVDASYIPTVESAIAFYTPEARPVIEAAIDTARRTGQGWDLELPFIRADGRHIWVRAVGTVILEENKPVRFIGAFQDITERVERARALREAQERVTLATDSAQIGIWEWNLKTGAKIWSPLMFQLYGLTSADPPATLDAWRARLHEDDRDDAAQSLLDAISGKRPYKTEFRVVWDDGSHHYLRGASTVEVDCEGQPVRIVGASWDVTESRVLAHALTNSNELLRVTLQSIGDGVITTDAQGRIVWMNPVAEQLTGWPSYAAANQPLPEVFRIFDEETREPAPDPTESCLTERRVVGLAANTILTSRHGDEYGIVASAAPLSGKSGETLGVVLVFHDVTVQRRHINSEIAHRATHDALTGLLNRAEFEVRLRFLLHKSKADQKQSVMLYLDLDQFKLVNDTCGHHAGDLLLKEIALLLTEFTRGHDSVARLGSDEFAVLLDGCAVEQAAIEAQKFCDRMEHFRFTYEEQRFRVGASIGVVPVDGRWLDIDGIMQAADACCYAAKVAGRNRVHVWSDDDKAAHTRHDEAQWAGRLAKALDDDLFVLFAQQIHTLQSDPPEARQGVHAEVLLRMVGADKKLYLPGAFLPAAERFHMISQIDRWVLDHAIAWMGALPDLGMIETLAVNISGHSVSDTAFQAWVINRLAEAGPRLCQRLCLELTETAVVTNMTAAARFIEQVRQVGVRVALDDFGAGASSFGYLKSLPVDFLKIDGQFVRNLVGNSLDEAAVRSFIDVAGVVGLQTIAEFVHRQAIMEKLQAMGVHYAQGYLLHKPAPIEELLAR